MYLYPTFSIPAVFLKKKTLHNPYLYVFVYRCNNKLIANLRRKKRIEHRGERVSSGECPSEKNTEEKE